MNLLSILLLLPPLLTTATTISPRASKELKPGIGITCLNPTANIPKYPHVFGNTGVTIYRAIPEMALAVSGTYEADDMKYGCWDTPNPLYRIIFSVLNGPEFKRYPVKNEKGQSEFMFGLVLEKCRDFGGVGYLRDIPRFNWEFTIKAEPGRCANFGVKA